MKMDRRDGRDRRVHVSGRRDRRRDRRIAVVPVTLEYLSSR